MAHNAQAEYLRAENEVALMLQTSGLRLLARNYRRRGTELDIVALDGATLVFVEVKFRRYFRVSHESLCELLPPRKLRSLRVGMQLYCQEMEGVVEWETLRLDLAIVAPKYEKIRGSTSVSSRNVILGYFRNLSY